MILAKNNVLLNYFSKMSTEIILTILANIEAKPLPITQRFSISVSKFATSEAMIASVVATKYPLISIKQTRDRMNPVNLSSTSESKGIAMKPKIAII